MCYRLTCSGKNAVFAIKNRDQAHSLEFLWSSSYIQFCQSRYTVLRICVLIHIHRRDKIATCQGSAVIKSVTSYLASSIFIK
jgi:hypothetical protein